MQETWVQPLDWEDPLQKEMATHFSILAWKIPWKGSLAGYSPWGGKRVGLDFAIKNNKQRKTGGSARQREPLPRPLELSLVPNAGLSHSSLAGEEHREKGDAPMFVHVWRVLHVNQEHPLPTSSLPASPSFQSSRRLPSGFLSCQAPVLTWHVILLT